jgi:hypothetical protein
LDEFTVLSLQQARGTRKLSGKDQQPMWGGRDIEMAVIVQRHSVREQGLDLAIREMPVCRVQHFDYVSSLVDQTEPLPTDLNEPLLVDSGFDRLTIRLVDEQIPVAPRRRQGADDEYRPRGRFDDVWHIQFGRDCRRDRTMCSVRCRASSDALDLE